MIKFNKPENLNGTELLDELNAVGIKITEPPLIDGNGDLWLNIAAKNQEKATAIVAAHNGTIVALDKSAEKAAILDRIGLTADELKTILG